MSNFLVSLALETCLLGSLICMQHTSSYTFIKTRHTLLDRCIFLLVSLFIIQPWNHICYTFTVIPTYPQHAHREVSDLNIKHRASHIRVKLNIDQVLNGKTRKSLTPSPQALLAAENTLDSSSLRSPLVLPAVEVLSSTRKSFK